MPTFDNARVLVSIIELLLVSIIELLHITDADKSFLGEIHFAERLREDREQEFGLLDNR